MKSIRKIYTDLDDIELMQILSEIEESEINGSYPNNSKIREIAKQSAHITGMDISSNLLLVQMNVLKEAAFRWKLEKDLKATDRDDLEIKDKF